MEPGLHQEKLGKVVLQEMKVVDTWFFLQQIHLECQPCAS